MAVKAPADRGPPILLPDQQRVLPVVPLVNGWYGRLDE